MTTLTETRGCGAHYKEAGQQTIGTHPHIAFKFSVWLTPLAATFSFSCGPLMIDSFPHSLDLMCAVASLDSLGPPLGAALFFLSLQIAKKSPAIHENHLHFNSVVLPVFFYKQNRMKRDMKI